jgi:nitric oxide reductase NorQ protein
MINGIGLQWASMGSMSARQVMLFPASLTGYARTVSVAHPRKPWVPITYAPLTNPFGDSTITNVLNMQVWDERSTANDFLTSEPFGFTISDDEWTEMITTSVVPRNVPLRYLRALDEYKGTMLGAGARALGEIRQNGGGMLDLITGTLTGYRLTQRLQDLIGAVEAKDASLLDAITPAAARARGDNVQRNQQNLPVAVPVTAPVAPVAPSVVLPTPAPPVPVAGLVKPGARLTRPNGDVYVARKVSTDDGTLSDVMMLRRAWDKGMNVMLFGVPGTGKTALCEVAADKGMITVLGTGELTADDFLGQWVQTGPDAYEWMDGPLPIAMERGWKLLIDEIGVIDPRALTQVYGVMDGRNKVTIPANPMRGTIEAAEGFAIVCATNPNAPGVRLSEALLSRMHVMVEVTTSFSVARSLGVNPKLVAAAEHFDKLVKSEEISWGPQMREMLAFKGTEEAFGTVFALRNLLNQAPLQDQELVMTQLRERFGDIAGISRKVKPLTIDD